MLWRDVPLQLLAHDSGWKCHSAVHPLTCLTESCTAPAQAQVTLAGHDPPAILTQEPQGMDRAWRTHHDMALTRGGRGRERMLDTPMVARHLSQQPADTAHTAGFLLLENRNKELRVASLATPASRVGRGQL